MRTKIEELNEFFLAHALRSERLYLMDVQDKLQERQQIINDNFQFTTENIEKLQRINEILRMKTVQAYKQAWKIEKYLLDTIKIPETFISDYEISFEISLFAEKKYEHIEEMQGNSFFSYVPFLLTFHKSDALHKEINKEIEAWLFDENHNEFQNRKEHPLNNQNHCALLHDLYDHTILSWQDIVDIEEVWFEINVRVQNFSDFT